VFNQFGVLKSRFYLEDSIFDENILLGDGSLLKLSVAKGKGELENIGQGREMLLPKPADFGLFCPYVRVQT
jgi:hypothetical protein